MTYNTSQETRDPDKLWLQICAKRDECDKAMKKIKQMAFFFSSVAVVEKKVEENECEEDKEGDEETANKTSQRKKKIYWPAISYAYWIALQSRDGLRVSTIPVHSALLVTGMEVTAKSVQECTRGKEENLLLVSTRTKICLKVLIEDPSLRQIPSRHKVLLDIRAPWSRLPAIFAFGNALLPQQSCASGLRKSCPVRCY